MGVAFATNNDLKMYIASSGNVGIGTEDPTSIFMTSKDHVNGSIYVDYMMDGQTMAGWESGTGLVMAFRANAGTVLYGAIGGYSNTEPGIGIWSNPTAAGSGTQITGTPQLYVANGGNVGIGTTSPAASALLDITSTTKGFLPPRMTTAQVNAISSPSDGMVVYDTDTDTLKVRANGAWTSLSSSGGSLTLNTQVFTSSGTYTPTAGMKYVRIRVQAPGGGGGGADGPGDGQGTAGGGGGGGEYAEGTFSAATIGASQTVTINTAGTAGTSAGGNGGNGGSVSVGSLITASGGSGGSGSGADSVVERLLTNGGSGGTGGSGGSFRIPGQDGSQGEAMGDTGSGVTWRHSGGGGNATLGFGGQGKIVNMDHNSDIAGSAGKNYGGGGGGGLDDDTTGSAGGAGGPGIVIIEEFM
jgi:hypothetical protein